MILVACPTTGPGSVEAGEAQARQDHAASGPIEEIVVTGSRLKRSNLDSPSPVMVFDSEALLDNGITTMDEFARYLPQNTDTFSDSMTAGGPFRGSAAINLRGVGLDATLTLLNGRRVAPFASSGDRSPFVDINSIPVAAIDRIEVLKDGASAIYGSEAVAGVVNIVTRKRIDEITVEGGYLTTSEGDGDEWDVNIAGGWNSESTSLTATLSYFERDIIWKRDREWASDVDFRDRGGANFRSQLSSPPTAILLDSGRILADPECPEQSATHSREVVVPGAVEFCRFNYAYYMSLQQPSDRIGLTATLERDFQRGLSLFAEALYSENQTQSVMAPTPYANRLVPDFHPHNPFGENLFLLGRLLDIGDRGFESDVVSWRVLAGLRGGISDWEWEAALMSSQSELEDARINGVLAVEFERALLGLGGPGGNRFYNPFGLGTRNDPEILNEFLSSGSVRGATTEETTADVQITGSFGELPGGPVGAAFGVQARAQELSQFADDIELGGAFLGSGGFLPIRVDREIYSVFTEFLLPVHDRLEAQLALRYDHYSDFGSTTNPKVGLGWRPREDMLVRATWGTSFRPPTFQELYAPFQQFLGFIQRDPHRCPVTGDPIDCFGTVVQGEFRGNPELDPDEGETVLFGLAWEPQFAEGLALALDFWQLSHDNRIFASNDFFIGQILLERLDPFTNPFTERAPQTPDDALLNIPGRLVGLRHTYENGNALETNGVDFEASYAFSRPRAGNFSFSLNYSYLNEFTFGVEFRDADFENDFAGQYGFRGGLPQHRANLRFNWTRNAQNLSALVSYSGEFESWQSLHIDGVPTERPFTIDAYAQLDLQYSYVFEQLGGGMLRVGCRNCSDQDPPTYNQSVDAEAFHEGRGAVIYLRWSQPF